MSIFIDTGIFIGYINKYGAAFTSNVVFDEAVTFALYKTVNI